jgi:DNA polymerase III delta subunit
MILLLFGEDSFGGWRTLKKIKNRFLSSQDPNNLIELSGEELSPASLDNLLHAQTLFAGHRLIILRDVLGKAPAAVKDALATQLAADLSETTTVIFWET